jgi:putative hydrolase of the HAD superfamily
MRAVLLDLDDTLYPEEAFVLSGFRAVADWAERELGIPADEGGAELEALFRAGVRGDTFDRWLAAREVARDGAVAEAVSVYRGHDPAIQPFPEAAPLLDGLRAEHRLGLLSDGEDEVQRRKLRALGLEHRFDAVLVTGELGREHWKPSPRGFEVLLERLGAVPGDAVYVSDNPSKDFLGARRAGIRSLRVRRAGGLYAALDPPTPEHAPDAEVAGLAEVQAALEAIWLQRR